VANTMSRFSPLVQLLDDIPPDIDITQPKYLFSQSEWEEAPVLTVVSIPQRDHLDRRLAQDALYRNVGNPTTWNQYVTLGYYVFDDCFQFDTQWMKLCTDLTKKYKFMWFSYTYYTTRHLEVPTQLSAWAIDIARPHLQTHLPDGYNPETKDPRDGRFDDSDDDMDSTDEDEKESVLKTDEAGWTLMGPHGKPVRDLHPASAPTPVPPVARMPPPPSRMPPPPTPTRRIEPRGQQKQVAHNDGTLRVTIKWSPPNFSELPPTDSTAWATCATDVLHFLFITAPDCSYHTWDTKATQQILPILLLTPDNLYDFLSPGITTIADHSMFVFGVRVSMCNGGAPGPWINNQSTQAALQQHHVEVSLSNATSDSGDVIIAGYILLKDPHDTHRQHYCSHLHETFTTLPYFDIGVHRRTPQGEDTPHLVIRCGEKVAEQLSLNLSVNLNGIESTAIFISREHVMNAPPEEVRGIFEMQANYMNTIKRISMSPHITHLDRLRIENKTANSSAMERSTRQWAAALKDSNGNSMQCDVECGARNRQVYLLVPTHHTELAHIEINLYLARLANLRPSTILNYQPKAAIITNVEFLRNMSQSNVWSTIPTSPPPVNFRPNAPGPNVVTPSHPVDPRTDSTSLGTASVGAASTRTSPSKFNYAAKRPAFDDQGTITTFASAQTARFDAMEAEIKNNQTAISRHQAAFKSVHERFDSVEDKAIRTMEVCQTSSKSILELREESFQQMSVLREETAISMRTLREEAALFQTNLQGQLSLLGDLIRSNATSQHQPTQSSSSTSSSSSNSSGSLMSTVSTPPNSISHALVVAPSNQSSLQSAIQPTGNQTPSDKKRVREAISKPTPDQDYDPDGGSL
jgi:hypothetical protein